MNLIKIICTGFLALVFSGLSAQENPLWMRYPAISPDGKTIAFCYKGDIFLVSSEGGRATQLTTHPAYDSRPVWSPDGKTIAFTSARDEGLNLYTVPVSGGNFPHLRLSELLPDKSPGHIVNNPLRNEDFPFQFRIGSRR